jgi:hypothetical protein
MEIIWYYTIYIFCVLNKYDKITFYLKSNIHVCDRIQNSCPSPSADELLWIIVFIYKCQRLKVYDVNQSKYIIQTITT